MKKSFWLILLCVSLVLFNTVIDTVLIRISLGACAILMIVDIIMRIRRNENEQ